ncbi:hypothetical protein HMPREF0208_03189 [Citrobacter koseri]|nr:hypothetical protein HMPREF3207_04858 [Citrobacter koseri]KWZ99354.1 hypothetical protein HMPREF3220_02276 [Citrobacter koseri]KXB42308.1 hypothetical protein HMPREF0208_03189 [Citrobacter koseri]
MDASDGDAKTSYQAHSGAMPVGLISTASSGVKMPDGDVNVLSGLQV